MWSILDELWDLAVLSVMMIQEIASRKLQARRHALAKENEIYLIKCTLYVAIESSDIRRAVIKAMDSIDSGPNVFREWEAKLIEKPRQLKRRKKLAKLLEFRPYKSEVNSPTVLEILQSPSKNTDKVNDLEG